MAEPSARGQPSKFDDREVQLCWRWLEHAGKPRGREEEEEEEEREEEEEDDDERWAVQHLDVAVYLAL